MIVRPHSAGLLGTSKLVKCRFDSPAELRRHLGMKQGFYLPGLALPGEPGDRVLVEISFPGEPDPPLLHGWIQGHEAGGTWLDLPHARVTSRWMAGPDARRRKDRRIACDLFVEIQPPGMPPWMCRVLDVSSHGLRIAAASLEVGVAGDYLDATVVVPGQTQQIDKLPARIAWAGGHDAGLELVGCEQALWPLVAAAEARWTATPEVIHTQSCLCSAPALRAG